MQSPPQKNNQKNVSQKQLKDAPKNQTKNYKNNIKMPPKNGRHFIFKINSF